LVITHTTLCDPFAYVSRHIGVFPVNFCKIRSMFQAKPRVASINIAKVR
jgi:hypothetical protein